MIALRKFNFSSHYEQALRVALIDKLALKNAYTVPSIANSFLAINLKELSDFDDSRLIAAVFILRLLSGGRPYIARFGLFQTFHTKSYDALVHVNVRQMATYHMMGLLAERVLPFIAKADFTTNVVKKKNGILVFMTIADLSFIRVVETHSVFFRWHDKIRIALNFGCDDASHVLLLLSGLKFRLN